MNLKLKPSIVALLAAMGSAQSFAQDLDTMVVNADFRPETVQQTDASVSVISATEMAKRGAQHVENILNLAPNVNSASGGSRANYYQIRGIGERSQFKTPINPSVGLMVDGIDYSRTGAAANLFDTKQVEILRGPQGTRFGANAMAGMILVESTEPSAETDARIEVSMGSRNEQTVGVALGGTVIENTVLGRIAIQKHLSDGYMTNSHLDRTDTQNQDELNATAQLRFLVTDDLTVDLTAKRFDIDNGYDAFNFNNDYDSQADEPGKDTLKSDAYAVKATWDLNSKVTLEASATTSDSESEYSYDEDWSYVGFHPWEYSSFDQYLRDRNNQSYELRFLSSESGRILNNSTDWVAGVYHLNQDESLVRNYTYNSGPFTSDYETQNTAAYGQLDHHLTDKVTITTGVRVEKFNADYQDSDGMDSSTEETLYGGKLGVSYQANQNHLGFASVSRGYKAGGVNAEGDIPEQNVAFDTEYLWNLEAGVNSKLLNNRLNTRIALFYSKRFDQQVNSSLLVERSDGSTDFIGYLANAAEGKNYGLEADLDWSLNDKVRLVSSLGLLRATFTDYEYVDPSSQEQVNLDGEKQAHAPLYQYSVGAEYFVTANLIVSANVEGKGEFNFSNRHQAKSDPMKIVNASAEYSFDDLTFTLWSRNLLDAEYDTRGFGSFGNNPANGYTTEKYTQKGEPRTVGVTVSWDY